MTNIFAKEVPSLTNYELDHQIRVFSAAAQSSPAVRKYQDRLTLLRIEADHRNFETK
jgi:hypothetical protein